jgi:N-carbamoyl-L-amino-acid hydrolase
VKGISWTEFTLSGQSNHAGTTPMRLRRDAGYIAAQIAVFARNLATEIGGNQIATAGSMTLSPNLINVVADHVMMTVDLRNTNDERLQEAERRLLKQSLVSSAFRSGACPAAPDMMRRSWLRSVRPGGISHNVEEYTAPSDLAAGADVLLRLVLELAQ